MSAGERSGDIALSHDRVLLARCPDGIEWCTNHEIHKDFPGADQSWHLTNRVLIPGIEGLPNRPTFEGPVLADVYAYLQAGKDDNQPLIELNFLADTSGSDNAAWLTASEARRLSAELLVLAAMIDGASAADDGRPTGPRGTWLDGYAAGRSDLILAADPQAAGVTR